ncbi:MAG: cytoplasmic protein [Syntrophales bacterium]
MIKQEMILRNTMRQLGFESEEILPKGGFGAVLARAGVGKTAFLVQLALSGLLKEKKVLHISLNEPVDKVNVWYNELFRLLAAGDERVNKAAFLESLLPNRFIMTFRVEGFSVPKLEERLNDLSEQGIFSPSIMIIDGLNFEDSRISDIKELKKLAEKRGMQAWFTVQTHRHEEPVADSLPSSFAPFAELFEIIMELRHEHADVHIKVLRGSGAVSESALLDPTTMLIKEKF